MHNANRMCRLYRAKTLFQTNADLREEIAWLNPTALKHLKNYQIWHHRQTIVDKLGSSDGEADFIDSMLAKDTKNYHVWSYRQWLVRRFNLFNDKAELKWTESMIDDDVRNNSAWNHRWFLVFGGKEGQTVDKAIVDRELKYVAPVDGTQRKYTLTMLTATPKLPSAKRHKTRVHGIIFAALSAVSTSRCRRSRISRSSSRMLTSLTTCTQAMPSTPLPISTRKTKARKRMPRRHWIC